MPRLKKKNEENNNNALALFEKEQFADDFFSKRVRFTELYTNPDSPTYDNALQSGIRAGFSEEYSKCITYQKPAWFSEILGNNRLQKIVKDNIEKHLKLDPSIQAMGAFGPITKTEIIEVEKKLKNGKIKKVKEKVKVPVMVESTARLKLRQ